MERRLPRPLYIARRLIENLISAGSRFANATFFGGSTYQSVSARAYIDGRYTTKWAKRRDAIDAFFKAITGKADHCREAWEAEVEAAKKTLIRSHVMLESLMNDKDYLP